MAPRPGSGSAPDPVGRLLSAAAAALDRGPLRLVGTPLVGSHRTRVVRAVDPVGESVVVKEHLDDVASFVREASALAALTAGGRSAPTPRLLAEDRDRRLVVMTDVGSGPHLASRLLARGVGAAGSARAALGSWAEAVAALHTDSPSLAPAFTAELERRAAVAVVPPRDSALVADAVTRLTAGLARLDVSVSPSAREALLRLGDGFETDLEVLTPTDACPDNNVIAADGRMTLLDVEGAELRHPALDAAYLLVPWPTCWCAWTLEAEAAATALRRWREATAVVHPEVLTPAFDRDLARATTFWRWVTAGWFVGGALDETGGDEPSGKPAPTRRQRVQAGTRALRRTGTPVLDDLAATVVAATVERWGRLEVPPAPAFRAGPETLVAE